jgi:hypothetical protein
MYLSVPSGNSTKRVESLGTLSLICFPHIQIQRDAKQFDPAASLCAGTDSDHALGLIHRQLYEIPE